MNYEFILFENLIAGISQSSSPIDTIGIIETLNKENARLMAIFKSLLVVPMTKTTKGFIIEHYTRLLSLQDAAMDLPTTFSAIVYPTLIDLKVNLNINFRELLNEKPTPAEKLIVKSPEKEMATVIQMLSELGVLKTSSNEQLLQAMQGKSAIEIQFTPGYNAEKFAVALQSQKPFYIGKFARVFNWLF